MEIRNDGNPPSLGPRVESVMAVRPEAGRVCCQIRDDGNPAEGGKKKSRRGKMRREKLKKNVREEDQMQ